MLMERHGIDDQEAFNRLRAEARSSHRKLIEVASALLDSLSLLPRRPQDA
jgi:AmiR/NasT family two-component response regulator